MLFGVELRAIKCKLNDLLQIYLTVRLMELGARPQARNTVRLCWFTPTPPPWHLDSACSPSDFWQVWPFCLWTWGNPWASAGKRQRLCDEGVGAALTDAALLSCFLLTQKQNAQITNCSATVSEGSEKKAG
jgi:hypothetical protein